MVIIPSLVSKIRTKVEAGWAQIGPRSNTSYYLEMSQAIGQGISECANEMGFTTVDNGSGGSPSIPGVGLGTGIFPDREVLAVEIYNRIRQKSKTYAQSLGTDTGHPIWDRPYNLPLNYALPFTPPENNALLIFAKGISESVYECFSTEIILNSNHPFVYLGQGEVDSYTNIDSSKISGKIYSNSSSLQGVMWPQICDAIGEAVDFTLQNHTVAQVTITGTCSAGGGQTCGVPKSNVQGIGVIG